MLVLLDIAINYPGYPDPCTFHNLGIDGWKQGWEAAEPKSFYGYMNQSESAFDDWWGKEWVRCELPGYSLGGDNDHTMLLHGLPDFKTENERSVTLPTFLKRKPNTKAVDMPHTTVRGYLIKWLSDWVREYGVDGFRCDSAKHVEPETWIALKHACIRAKSEWWELQRTCAGATPHFWMLGEVYGHGVERSSYYDCGFDSLINFKFQDGVEQGTNLDALYEDYATQLFNHPELNFVSYISSHDTHLFSRKKIGFGSSALMLAPGGVMILYGDESGRLPGEWNQYDSAQAARSPMNWGDIDVALCLHWSKLAHFRAKHVSIARGIHLRVSDHPYTFARLGNDGDRVVVAFDAEGYLSLSTGAIFSDGEMVRDAYSSWRGVVSGGSVSLNAEGVVLLELDDD